MESDTFLTFWSMFDESTQHVMPNYQHWHYLHKESTIAEKLLTSPQACYVACFIACYQPVQCTIAQLILQAGVLQQANDLMRFYNAVLLADYQASTHISVLSKEFYLTAPLPCTMLLAPNVQEQLLGKHSLAYFCYLLHTVRYNPLPAYFMHCVQSISHSSAMMFRFTEMLNHYAVSCKQSLVELDLCNPQLKLVDSRSMATILSRSRGYYSMQTFPKTRRYILDTKHYYSIRVTRLLRRERLSVFAIMFYLLRLLQQSTSQLSGTYSQVHPLHLLLLLHASFALQSMMQAHQHLASHTISKLPNYKFSAMICAIYNGYVQDGKNFIYEQKINNLPCPCFTQAITENPNYLYRHFTVKEKRHLFNLYRTSSHRNSFTSA